MTPQNDPKDPETRLSETFSDLIDLLETDPEKVRQILIRLDPRDSEDLETISDRLRSLTDLYSRSKYILNSLYYLGVSLYYDPKTGETISENKYKQDPEEKTPETPSPIRSERYSKMTYGDRPSVFDSESGEILDRETGQILYSPETEDPEDLTD